MLILKEPRIVHVTFVIENVSVCVHVEVSLLDKFSAFLNCLKHAYGIYNFHRE